MAQRAKLCPRCGKLIGSEEAVCSWCGTARSAPWWQFIRWTRSGLEGDRILGALITINVVFFALSLLLGVIRGGGGILSPGQSSLFLLGATGTYPIDQYGRFWTLISASYLHGGVIHLIFNLMALRQILPMASGEYGPSRMFSIYTLGGLAGFVLSYLAGVPFTIGASAAVCGLIGAMLYYGKSRGGAYGNGVYRDVGGWVISLFVFGLIFPGINNWGHGGGIIGGIVLGMVLGYNDTRQENLFHRLLALLCVAVTVVVLVWSAFMAFMG